MKLYALPRVDGGVSIMECVNGAKPEDEIARWHPARRARFTGEVHEIDAAKLPKDKTHRSAWRFNGGRIEIDPVKRAELDARSEPKTLEERVLALEAKRAQ